MEENDNFEFTDLLNLEGIPDIPDYIIDLDIIPEELFLQEPQKKTKRIQKNYINNTDLTQALIVYKKEISRCQELDLPKPEIPKYIVESFIKLSEGMSRRPNFAAYPFRDDLVQDGVENCIRYFLNFDPEQKNSRGFVNPFGYFSRYVWCAFIRKIQKEKKEQYIKYKFTELVGIMDFAESSESKDGSVQQVEIYNNLYDFIRKFEEAEMRKIKKGIKLKKEKLQGIELFLED